MFARKLLTYMPLLLTGAYLTACSTAPQGPVSYTPQSFKTIMESLDATQLSGADIAELRTHLNNTCQRYSKKPAQKQIHANPLFGTYGDWQKACADIKGVHDDNLAFYLYSMFSVYEVKAKDKSLFTGYYAPIVEGSYTKSANFSYPLYAYPKDIFMADLGLFDNKLKGQKIYARVDEKRQKIIPYYTRAELEKDYGQKTPLIWLKDETDAFFMHIQGSGWVKLPNGDLVNVAYGGNNGHKYTAIGGTLIKHGHMKKEDVNMDSIRNWLANNPQKRDEIFNSNKRYIFFRKSKSTDVKGSFGVPLKAERSLAVDPNYIPLGVPVVVNTTVTATNKPYTNVMFAQDTGAAINGAVRGDIYFGIGDEAARLAGEQNSPGRLFVLVPKKSS